jgi:hypothetical protein
MTDTKPKESTLLDPSPININPAPIGTGDKDNKNTTTNEPENKKVENKQPETKKEEPKKDEKKQENKKQDDKLKLTSGQLINAHVAQIVKSQFEEEDIPYKVDSTYHQRLMEALKKGGVLRPKALFDGRDIDITKTEKEQIKEIEDKILEDAKTEQILKEEDLKKREKTIKEQEKNTPKIINDENSPLNNELIYTTLDDDLAKFSSCTKVYIDQYYKISDMFVICPLYFNYRISLEFDKPGEAYYLFDSIDLSPTCSHNCCPNQAKSVNMEIGSFGIGKGLRHTFAKFEKPYRCACLFCCACCTRPTFNVFINGGNEKIGFIREIRTACDPTMYVFTKNNTLKYKIVGSCCQCGYCCRDLCCGMCNAAKFNIYHGRDIEEEKPEGFIEKYKYSGNKVKPDYEQVTVVYPVTACCQDKVLILAAALFIEILYYQNINNSKRCSGHPSNV